MSSLEFGLVQSIFTLGGLIGALVAGPMSSKYGRLPTLQLIVIPTILGPFVSAAAPSVIFMSIGRFLSGIGAGSALVVVPIYISEIAPQQSRGFYGSFTQIMTNVGIFLAQLVGYWLSHDSAWRYILGIAGLIALLQAVQLTVTVESPRYLYEKGQHKEARIILERLRGMNDGLDEEIRSWTKSRDSDETQALLPDTTEQYESKDLSFLQVFTNPKYRPAVFAILLVMASQQLTGINSIVMYGVSLLSSLLSSSSALLNILVSLLNIIATTAFAPLTDSPRLGRKGCLILSITGMSVSSILLGIGIRASIKVLSAVCVLTFVASFALGLGPVPFMLASELVDTKGVSATQSWALAGNWIATFLVAQFFPIVNEKLGKGIVYFIFAGLGVLFVFSVSWYVPETRGKKNMQEVWEYEEERRGHED